MTDKKFTDEEIIEALECHINAEDCVGCEMFGRCDEIILTKLVLDLINRQKSEIERLKKEVSVARDAYISIQDRYEHTKTEAYKEFAERIRECCGLNNDLSTDAWLSVTADIDCVLKEMSGEQ